MVASCSDDNDSNPTLQVPSTFVLNEPALIGNTYDLANTTGVTLTWSQPDYGYTAAVKYYAQVSLVNDFTPAKPGTPAKFAEVEGAATSCKYTFPSNLFDAAVLKAGMIDEPDKVPYLTPLYVRLKATVGAGDAIVSNVIKLNVKPYYQELSSDPVLWYLAGNCIGDGKETNDSAAIGISLIPLSAVKDAKYNFNGDGEFTFTDYFPAGGKFHLLTNPGIKDVKPTYYGSADGKTGAAGEEGYFVIDDAGYYTITFNSKSSTFSLEAASKIPAAYTSISIPGSINGWNEKGNHMNPSNDHNGVNHVWYLDYEFGASSNDSGTADEVKFAADDAWTVNWGAEDFPMGFGVNNGKNIMVTQKGYYRVLFNDVTGFYSFMKTKKKK